MIYYEFNVILDKVKLFALIMNFFIDLLRRIPYMIFKKIVGFDYYFFNSFHFDASRMFLHFSSILVKFAHLNLLFEVRIPNFLNIFVKISFQIFYCVFLCLFHFVKKTLNEMFIFFLQHLMLAKKIMKVILIINRNCSKNFLFTRAYCFKRLLRFTLFLLILSVIWLLLKIRCRFIFLNKI